MAPLKTTVELHPGAEGVITVMMNAASKPAYRMAP